MKIWNAILIVCCAVGAAAEPALKVRNADLSGGTVTFSQLLSWCCFETLARGGAEMNVFASTYVGDHVPLHDKRVCITYEKGSKGSAAANVECRRLLSLVVDPDASVKVGVNGAQRKAAN